MTQSEIESLLTALKKARASGLRATTHGDTRLEYKSDQEMANAIADLERQLATASTTPRRGVNYIFQRDKGL
jgi:hypothetical protein